MVSLECRVCIWYQERIILCNLIIISGTYWFLSTWQLLYTFFFLQFNLSNKSLDWNNFHMFLILHIKRMNFVMYKLHLKKSYLAVQPPALCWFQKQCHWGAIPLCDMLATKMLWGTRRRQLSWPFVQNSWNNENHRSVN